MRALVVSLSVAVLAGCALYYGHRLDERYGTADPGRYDRPIAAAPGAPDYLRDVKPILDNRCVVCHGCYDAPCQLNLASYQGLTRGSRVDEVYDGERLIAAEPTRLFADAQSSAAWRKKGFNAVLNERDPTPEANREASVLYRSLRLKRANPLPPGPILPAKQFDFSLDRAQQCPAIEEMEGFEKDHPQWGMPFGVPGLTEREFKVLAGWIEAGAPFREREPLSSAHLQRIATWERFFNGDSLKAQVMSRYIYEHLFIGHLYFEDLPGGEFFELVRSRTAPGQPIDPVVTRRPYDDPGVPRVYYRLRRVNDTLLSKTHMPYALSAARMAKFKAWFLDAPYEITQLPSYEAEAASNPFVTFRQVPINARYRFMLEEAQFTIMGFIKGPVCRGQVALSVITDQFWVAFVKPELMLQEGDEEFLARARNILRLPAERDSTAGLLAWRDYSKYEKQFLEEKARYLKERFKPPTMDMLWDGDGTNPNAALTVFRHFDSASVVQGFVGGRPQTAWVIGYALLERIHYLLVAGFDVYGNAGHQLATRLYMDFLRMEGELNFLGFLPRAARQPVRDHWYRDAGEQHIEQFRNTDAYYSGETGISFKTAKPLEEMYGLLVARMAPVQSPRYSLPASGLAGAPLQNLQALASLRGRAISHLPETAFLTVRGAPGGDHHFSLISNNAHSNVASLFGEDRRRLPDEDTLSVLTGFVGNYPNAFLAVDAAQLPAFVEAARALASEEDYRKLLERYGIRRTDERFWSHSDALAGAYRRMAPLEAGLFDYGRFENR